MASTSDNTQKKMKERLQDILQARSSGMTFTEIGEVFSISRFRAQYLYSRALYFQKEKTENPFKYSLSVRTKNCLMNYFGDAAVFENPEKIVETGYARLSLTKNMGHTSLVELATQLVKFKYLKSAKKWIAKGKKERHHVSEAVRKERSARYFNAVEWLE